MSDPQLHAILPEPEDQFRTAEQARPAIEEACAAHPDLATHHEIGTSEAGRPIDAVTLGRGSRRVSLIAGNHPDEPVGAETLRHLIVEGLRPRDRLDELFERFTFCIVPHVNPDGEANNWPWMRDWPDPLSYIRHADREPPGRDVEFGYPDMRPENRAVAGFLREHAPFEMHGSLHGMAVADGAWLLIERHWIDRTKALRRRWLEAIEAAGLPAFDWDRGGEKGFEYIGPGFSTTPEGRAMREHFESIGEPDPAGKFHDSSMEDVRSLGGDPLCLVTELPLFVLRSQVGEPEPGVPATFLKFKETLPELRRRVEREESIESLLELVQPFQPEPVDLPTAVRLQLTAIDLGLLTVSGAESG
jgi:hypothetical protein